MTKFHPWDYNRNKLKQIPNKPLVLERTKFINGPYLP